LPQLGAPFARCGYLSPMAQARQGADAEPFEDVAAEPHVTGWLHRAAPAGDGLVLTHGAGGDANQAVLVALARAFARADVTVLRCDLPYRQARRRTPPSPSGAERDRAGLGRAVRALRALVPGRVFLGGQSYGGRQATMLASSEPGLVDGLLLLSYPLHPPAQPGRPRTAHFPALRTPALFVQGSADPFGSLDEMKAALTLVPARVELLSVGGAGHDLVRAPTFDPASIVTRFLALIR